MANRSSAEPPRLIESTLSLSIASALSLGFGLLGTIIATRNFPAEVFGTYILLQVIISFLSQVSGLGLSMATPKFIAGADGDEYRRHLIGTAVLARLGTILVASGLAWLGWPLLLMLFGASLLPSLVIFVAWLFFLETFRTMLRCILQGFFRFSRIGITDLITSSANLVLLVGVIALGQNDIMGLIVARAGALVVACAFAYLSIPIKNMLGFRIDIFRELMKFGFPLQINDVLSFVFSRIDTIIIGALLGPAGIAYYEVARKIPESLRNFFDPFRSVYYPFLAKSFALAEHQKAARLLNNSTRLIAFASILGAAVVLLFAQDIVRLLFSERYLPSVPAFIWLMISLSLSLIGEVLGISLIAVGESNKPALVNIVHTAVSVLGNLWLIPALGIVGAAITSAAGSIATNPLNALFLRRRLAVSEAAYLKPLLIFSGWALFELVLKPEMFLERVGLIALFILPCLLLSVVTRNDLAVLWAESGVSALGPLRRLWPRSKEI